MRTDYVHILIDYGEKDRQLSSGFRVNKSFSRTGIRSILLRRDTQNSDTSNHGADIARDERSNRTQQLQSLQHASNGFITKAFL